MKAVSSRKSNVCQLRRSSELGVCKTASFRSIVLAQDHVAQRLPGTKLSGGQNRSFGDRPRPLRLFISELINRKTGRIETAQEWLGRTSTAHTRTYIDAEGYRAKLAGDSGMKLAAPSGVFEKVTKFAPEQVVNFIPEQMAT